ncbi:MAG: hypothetical protein WCF19_04075 [Chlamydiales bacterium]
MFFFRRKTVKGSPQRPVEVFVRHCHYSAASQHKQRPAGFSKEACYRNLLATLDERIRLTHFLDTARDGDHFLKGQAIEINEGTEAGSFLRMLEYVASLALHPDQIVYFLEDDYLHRPGWIDVLLEGFSTAADYVTLYDHLDKYTLYPKLSSKIFATASCHWRTTPSTTNTYAMRFSTLKEDFSIHRRFSLGRKITADHDKFCFLKKRGAMLISSIPGWATHADVEYASPCINWAPFYKENLCKR